MKAYFEKYLPQIIVGIISGLAVLAGDKLYDRFTEVPLPLVYPLHFDGQFSNTGAGYELIARLDNFTGGDIRIDEVVMIAYDGAGHELKKASIQTSSKTLAEKKYILFDVSFSETESPEALVFCSKYFAGNENRESREELVIYNYGGSYHVTSATRDRLNLIRKLGSC